MKIVAVIFTLFCLLVVTQLFVTEMQAFAPRQMQDENLVNLFLRKQGKYVGNGSFEAVSFSAQKVSEGNARALREGILVKRPNAQGTVLICHGFMCNKTDTAFLRSLFDTFNVMTFDFRAHGESCKEEDCCTFGRDEAFDVMGAVRYLRSRSDLDFEHKPLIGYGFSMGAVAAIQAQAQNESLFDALVLDCPYDQSINIIKRGLDNLKLTFFGYTFDVPGKGLLEKYAFHPFVQGLLKQVLKSVAQMDATATNTVIYPLSPVESVKKINVPCFFIHCKNDEKVGISAAKGLFQGAKGYKRLWLTAGRRHFDSFFFNPEKYAYKIKQFLSDVLSKEYEKKKQAKIVEDVIVS